MLSQVPSENLSLLVGKNESENLVFIPEKSLYQNIFICGTIGSGKTSSCMYPFTRQLIRSFSKNPEHKIGMFVLLIQRVD